MGTFLNPTYHFMRLYGLSRFKLPSNILKNLMLFHSHKLLQDTAPCNQFPYFGKPTALIQPQPSSPGGGDTDYSLIRVHHQVQNQGTISRSLRHGRIAMRTRQKQTLFLVTDPQVSKTEGKVMPTYSNNSALSNARTPFLFSSSKD